MKPRVDGVAMASAGPHANHLHLAPVPHHSVFTGQMPFLLPDQQRQSTKGNIEIVNTVIVIKQS